MIKKSSKTAGLKLAENNFRRWNRILLTRDPRKIANLYSEDASFHPTMSGDFKIGQKEAEGYFEHFMLQNPSGKIIKQKVQPMGSQNYIHSGLYDFEVGPENRRETLEARFTYVWGKDKKGHWRILHHHSSVKPK